MRLLDRKERLRQKRDFCWVRSKVDQFSINLFQRFSRSKNIEWFMFAFYILRTEKCEFSHVSVSSKPENTKICLIRGCVRYCQKSATAFREISLREQWSTEMGWVGVVAIATDNVAVRQLFKRFKFSSALWLLKILKHFASKKDSYVASFLHHLKFSWVQFLSVFRLFRSFNSQSPQKRQINLARETCPHSRISGFTVMHGVLFLNRTYYL